MAGVVVVQEGVREVRQYVEPGVVGVRTKGTSLLFIKGQDTMSGSFK